MKQDKILIIIYEIFRIVIINVYITHSILHWDNYNLILFYEFATNRNLTSVELMHHTFQLGRPQSNEHWLYERKIKEKSWCSIQSKSDTVKEKALKMLIEQKKNPPFIPIFCQTSTSAYRFMFYASKNTSKSCLILKVKHDENDKFPIIMLRCTSISSLPYTFYKFVYQKHV